MRLANKVCIVTGGNRGLGKAIAEAFQKEGALVAITYKRQTERGRVSANRGIIMESSHQMDVRDRASIREAFQQIAQFYGHVDVLVNNAGINHTNDFNAQTDDEWDEVIDVNLSGVFRCCQEVLPILKNGGRIINIGSLSGEYGGPRSPAYACAKAGLKGLTHNLARFLAPRNICVNTLSPGVIESEFTDKSMSAEVAQTAHSLILLDRFATYDEMTGAAVFLASDESSYMTAQTLSINGGAWA